MWRHRTNAHVFPTRDRAKAEAVAAKHDRARAGDFDDAAAFGDVILYAVRGVFPSALLRAPQALAGKVVIDCNNRDFDSRIDRPTPRGDPNLGRVATVNSERRRQRERRSAHLQRGEPAGELVP
ncbi:NAD(P)-binding domain-containing protein [Sorangium sp. So ce260]|uniref:NAD(P)-binding domain-containing protein n=1 Tax=Sorangium sp. So ce260 TaxID=3133291 RepID=UPI003F623C17